MAKQVLRHFRKHPGTVEKGRAHGDRHQESGGGAPEIGGTPMVGLLVGGSFPQPKASCSDHPAAVEHRELAVPRLSERNAGVGSDDGPVS